jgi:flavocytochrome c
MPKWDETADIVVIGSGLAGLSAAIEARRAGRRVVVFEKMKILGGNTRISDGALAAAGNFLQRKYGIADSPQLFAEDMQRAGRGRSHPELVRTLAEQAAAAIDWTRNELGVRYRDRVDRFGGHSVARSLTTSSHCGVDIVKAQTAQLKALGVEMRTRCRLERLLRNRTGAVNGIALRCGDEASSEKGGSLVRIHAGRAVVLATGGFASDCKLRTLLHPRLGAPFQSTNHAGATAEGLFAAVRVGAVPVHLSWIQLGPWGCPDEKGYGRGGRFASYAVFPAGILIDPATGRRVVNEWADRQERAEAMMKVGHPCLGIVDAVGARADPDSLKHGLKSGRVRAFETLAALAEAFAVPETTLQETVADYNQHVAQGRTDGFRKALTPSTPRIAVPPLYTLRLWPKVHYTPGGIGINAKAQVLGFDGKPIPRLYAAGEVCGGVHGVSRLGSCALTEGLVFGRIAGREAASLSA